MPSEELKPKGLTGFLVRHKYVFTMLAMANFALVMKFYSQEQMKLAIFLLGTGIILLTFKSHLIQRDGESIVKQIEQWLFEFAVILIFSGYSSAEFNPVFGASALVLGVVCLLIFLLLAMRNIIN